ncbi:MAG: hypothetical protein DWQ35_21930 [Planctomycetota bacterium]|nr:MAG: hypothetical protein DWQ35_21930 [Planctomycetota bacterium]
MARKRKLRRQSHGSAWYWSQTRCWCYTLPGTKNRVPLSSRMFHHSRTMLVVQWSFPSAP